MANNSSWHRDKSGRFSGKGLGIGHSDSPICCQYPLEMKEFLKSLPNRSTWLREAAQEKRVREQKLWELVGVEDLEQLKEKIGADSLDALHDIYGGVVEQPGKDSQISLCEERKPVLMELEQEDIDWLSRQPGGAMYHLRQAIAAYRASLNSSAKKV